MRKALLPLLPLLAVLLAAPAQVRAQDAEARAAVQSHLRKATKHFKKRRFKAAIKHLRRAHELVPMPDNLYNIGRCYQELGGVDEAVAHFEAYLHEGDDSVKLQRARKALTRLGPEVWGTLAVACAPAGAKVTVEGLGEGTCPYEREHVRRGPWTVRIEAEGHAAVEREVTVLTGQTARLDAKLRAIPGRLTVRPKPAGARIRLGGQDLGRAAVEGHEVAPGVYAIQVERRGYKPHEGTVVVRAGEHTEVAPALVADGAALAIVAEPIGARVRIDGELVGNAPLASHRLKPGAYDITVEAPWRASWTGRIEAGDGDELTLNTKLPSRGMAYALTAGAVALAAGAGASWAFTSEAYGDRDHAKSKYDGSGDAIDATALGAEVRRLEDDAALLLATSWALTGAAAALGGVGAWLLTEQASGRVGPPAGSAGP